MKKKLLAGLALAATGFGVPAISDPNSSIVASQIKPEVNPILSEVKAGQPKRILYELEAVGYYVIIPLTGKATFDVRLDGDFYNIRTHVKTTGLVDMFKGYDLHVAASGYVHDQDLMSYNFVSQNQDGKKNRRVELTYGEQDVKMEAKPAFTDLGFPPATPEQKLAARDPITAFIGAAFRPRPADNPCGNEIRFFDGKQLTYMSFTPIGETDVRTKAYKGKAFECHVTLNRVAGYDEDERGSNLSGIDGPMRMFFAEPQDGFVTPVKLIVDTEDIGKITVSAKKLEIHDAG